LDVLGGFSHVFAKPDYQNTLPAGSTPIARPVPDRRGSARYAADFFDVTTATTPTRSTRRPRTPATRPPAAGDPVIGLGTPNAARLLPDLVAAAHGH
jgi:hypothetical protein